MQHQPFPLTSVLDDLIVITAIAPAGEPRTDQTIVQRVGAEHEPLRAQWTRSEQDARGEHRRAELWSASHVVERWLRSGASSASNERVADAFRLPDS